MLCMNFLNNMKKYIFLIFYISLFFGLQSFAQSNIDIFVNKKDTLWINADTSFRRYIIISDNPYSFKTYADDVPLEKLLIGEKFRIKSTPTLFEICKTAISKRKLEKLIKDPKKMSIYVILKNEEKLKIVKVIFFVQDNILSNNDLLKIRKQIYKKFKPIIISPNDNYKIFDYVSDALFFYGLTSSKNKIDK